MGGNRALERVLTLVVPCCLAGCADPWAQYEDSLYGALKVPNPEVYAGHADLLRQIVEYRRDNNLKPPPGVLAEHGFYLARTGRADEAKRYFRAEVETYPESAVFVAALERAIEGHRAFQPDAESKDKTGSKTKSTKTKSMPKSKPEP